MDNHSQPQNQPRHNLLQYVQVKSFKDITSGIRRITFTGDKLHLYPKNCEAQHLKLFLAQSHQIKPVLPTFSANGPVWPADNERPIVRTYTVRSIRPEQQEIDIEFALHDHSAPAIDFAKAAKPGIWLGISGPSEIKIQVLSAQHIFMAGDQTSLPAIAALVEKMHADTQGKIIVRIDKSEHKQCISLPKNIEIIWVVGDIIKTNELIETFKLWSLPVNNVAFWLGGEEQIVKVLRHYLRQEKNYSSAQIYAIPYWRYGYNEESYHNLRHQIIDMNEQN